MISSMLMCLAFSLISANLISSTSIDVSVIDTLNLRASLPSDSTGFANTKCTVDSILEEPADKLVESNSDIEKASNIARRKTNECRLMEMGGEPPRWATWENWMDIGWRAPATAPEMLEHAQPPQSIIDSEFCLNKLYPHLLSCSTPEVWYDGVMGLVLNCVKGLQRETPQRLTWGRDNMLNQYCCNDFFDVRPLWAGFLCQTVVEKWSPVIMNYADLNKWMDRGMP